MGEVLSANGAGEQCGGAALIVDYGGENAFGDSFRVSHFPVDRLGIDDLHERAQGIQGPQNRGRLSSAWGV